jgi:hypothetical protein
MIPGQVNSIRYQLNAKFQNTGIELCSWTIIKVGDIYTLSGPQATAVVLDNKGDYEAGCNTNGFFDAYKVSEPEIIPPLVSTEVTYTIFIENIKSNTQKIADVVDYLPPGFEYYATIDGITLDDPVISTDNVNGVVRDKLTWSPQYSIAAAETVNMTFIAIATQGVSGSYFNEVLVLPNTVPTMTELDQIDDEYNWELNLGQTYSWNSGTVIVPAFDSETSANGENISTNLALTPDGVIINSWHIK